MTLRRLVLWRHGETDYNASGRMQGHIDSNLTEVGRNQARFAVPALARFSPDVVVASDLRRATDTATVFSEAIGVPLRVDKRLRETNLGLWQGKTGAEIDQEWPGGRAEWQTDATWTPPGGESRVEVAARATEVVAGLDEGTDETAVLCAHGGLITALAGSLLELPVGNWWQLGGISNCHWTVLARRETSGLAWRLIAYNVGITG
ncbi:histidine phosphatase family protein [Actinokineospora terrae]|uniref:Glucosyl-3-phosphoglycerate phosphatase (Pgm family) n=1 Tax=Actinokineospora terrae TaxID=155974 RepID=A0A1H9QYP0_9PSEU|nr:histidine phosphatase family protein [Actinokineospora terrae]SER65580.1 glucosyl-3-phosphoglycerate phosphatase (pgm family) [Actinokineospora terrae]